MYTKKYRFNMYALVHV